jgi:PAS domain S-box-containing protein
MDISEVRGSGRGDEMAQLELLGALNQNLPASFVILDLTFRFVRVNKVTQMLLGYKEADLIGRSVSEVSPATSEQLEPVFRRVMYGETVTDWAFPESSDFLDENHRVASSSAGNLRLWAGTFFPIEFDHRVIGIGVLAVNRSREHLSEPALGEIREEVDLLVATNSACANATNVDELYHAICEIAVSLDDLVFAWVGEYQGGAIRSIAQGGIDKGYLHETLMISIRDDVFAPGPTGQSLITASPYVANDFALTPLMRPWRDAAARAGFAGSVAIPFVINGKPVATLTIYASTINRYTSHLVARLTSMVSIAAVAIERLQLRESEHRLADLMRMRDFTLGSIAHSMVICDPRQYDCPITYASPSFTRNTGYSEDEVLGRNCRFLQGPDTDPATGQKIHNAILAGRTCSVDILNYRKNGEPFWNHLQLFPFFNEEGVLTRYVGAQSDISERRRLEDQLMQSQKLEAIGTLAGGIAHDINNLLLVIQGYTSLIMGGTDDEELRATAARIQSAVERGAEFTQRLLAYSRQQIHRPEVINLNDTVNDSLLVLDSVIKSNVTLSTRFQEPISSVLVDPSQIQQIIFNLVNNSVAAMPDGGTIDIRSSEITLDGLSILRFEGCEAGRYVVLEVSDTGEGMDDTTRRRVFEPFFTTKKSGTGLGLASVYGIVRQSKGHIEVESQPGEGAMFRLYFPEVESAPGLTPMKPPIITDLQSSDIDVFGDETILIVENDEEVLTLLASALRAHGFVVLLANGGLDALDLSRRYNGKIDVLLTDVIMPEMNGHETANRIQKERPGVRVIFTSGYPSDLLHPKEFVGEPFVFISKPYQTINVARIIRNLLDQKGVD